MTQTEPQTTMEAVLPFLKKRTYATAEGLSNAIYRALLRAGYYPVKPRYDDNGDCLICGECGRCPGWHKGEPL